MTETDITIRELRRRFGEGSLSPLEYWLAFETHIAAWEPSICGALSLRPRGGPQAGRRPPRNAGAKGETLGALTAFR
jgi:aspartyl-tRNA(Asn)/glutamyl-tRNA(Gln) amidotransferase subunit A